MVMIYNNCGNYTITMKQKSKNQNRIQTLNSFFPRIIREFDDGPDEKPMFYGGKRHG